MKKKNDCKVTTRAKINYKISKSQFLRKSSFLIFGWGGVWLDVLGLSNKSVQSTQEKLNFYEKKGVDDIDPGCLEFLVKSRSRIKTLVFGIWDLGDWWICLLLPSWHTIIPASPFPSHESLVKLYSSLERKESISEIN